MIFDFVIQDGNVYVSGLKDFPVKKLDETLEYVQKGESMYNLIKYYCLPRYLFKYSDIFYRKQTLCGHQHEPKQQQIAHNISNYHRKS